ncbi:unnamed protein product [Closterium sp. NIES-53]
MFLRTDTSQPPFYVLVYVDDLVFATADIEALTLVKSELQKRHTWIDLGPSALWLPVLLAIAHSSVYQPLALSSTFGRVLRRAWGSCLEDGAQLSSLVTQTLHGSSCEAEIYAGAMASQELRWLTYLLNDSIQRGQLRLAYVATRANTADIFTKALLPGDHQHFATMLGLLAFLYLTDLMTTCIAAAALGASESALPCTITSSESSLRSVPDLDLHEEIWLHRPPGFTGSFPSGTQWSLRRPVYGLRQAPREWHDTLRTTLAALGFAPSTADPSLFLRTDTTLPPFYVIVNVDDLVFATADTEALAHVKSELQKRHTCTDLGELTSYLGLRITWDRAQVTITLTQSHMVQKVLQRFGFTFSSPQSTPLPTGHSLSAPPSDESIEPSGPYPELVGCLITSGMGLVLGGLARVVLTGHADSSWVDDLATQRSSQGYTFSLGSGSVSWRSTLSSSELRWLTYPLADLGEAPRSPPVLYVDNKAMLALYQEHRLEHRTKHIALRYFLARELQQRGQLRLAYVASQANTADVFTKALQPCDHQRFCTVLGLVPTVPHLLTS